jgi:hypothetical protein
MITRRRDELESRLSTLEAEYEELLGASQRYRGFDLCVHIILPTEKTIHDEETSNADIANSMAEFKVSFLNADISVILTRLSFPRTNLRHNTPLDEKLALPRSPISSSRLN